MVGENLDEKKNQKVYEKKSYFSVRTVPRGVKLFRGSGLIEESVGDNRRTQSMIRKERKPRSRSIKLSFSSLFISSWNNESVRNESRL